MSPEPRPDSSEPADSTTPREGRLRTSRKPPSAYRPDLRPMLILAGVLALVVIGWIVLSPLILPPAVR